MGYGTARSLFVAGDVQTVMQAFLGGRVRVDGDLSKLLDPRSGIWPAAPTSRPRPAQPGAARRRAVPPVRWPAKPWRRGTAAASNGGAGRAQPEPGLPGVQALALATRLKEITE